MMQMQHNSPAAAAVPVLLSLRQDIRALANSMRQAEMSEFRTEFGAQLVDSVVTKIHGAIADFVNDASAAAGHQAMGNAPGPFAANGFAGAPQPQFAFGHIAGELRADFHRMRLEWQSISIHLSRHKQQLELSFSQALAKRPMMCPPAHSASAASAGVAKQKTAAGTSTAILKNQKLAPEHFRRASDLNYCGKALVGLECARLPCGLDHPPPGVPWASQPEDTPRGRTLMSFQDPGALADMLASATAAAVRNIADYPTITTYRRKGSRSMAPASAPPGPPPPPGAGDAPSSG
jgi:hypothetical protein